MKKFTWSGLLALMLLFSIQVQAYNSTISVSTDQTSQKVVKSNQEAMNLKFHFGDIQTIDVKTPQGIFTELRMKGAYATNRIGEPTLPAQRKLIAIPFGAEINVQVNNFTVSTIDLDEKGINYPLMPLQYDLPKNIDPTDVPFQYNEQAYASKSFSQSEIATVEILGVMRGVRLARVTIEPVRFNPSTNQLEIYNDIDITISYEGADWAKTNETFKNSYTPFFDVVYGQLMNVDNIYDEHPDLLQFPVNMLVVADPMFTETLQPFLEWKTKMGYELTVAYTDEIGSSTSEVQTWVHDQYAEGFAAGNAPDFLVIVGDVQQVPASATGSESGKKTDLYYGSVDGDIYPEMYYGRLSAQNTTQLTNMLDKILYYQKYEFEDPTYLDNVTLIAGADGNWNPKVGQATIEYGTENYYNTDHGYNDIGVYLTSPYSGCYDPDRIAVGFINYTAHCGETSWSEPNLTIPAVNAFTNTNKYPIAIGNCCLAADFGHNECIGEAWMRAENKGAAGYIGSSPSSYWKEDMYWSVGAWPMSGDNNGYVPTPDETTMGAYDGAWGESYYCLDALAFVGNLAVSEVHIQGWTNHLTPSGFTPKYYWEAYNCIGDPSLMPYNTQGSVNAVSHMDIVPIGVTEYEVSAEPGSYVAVSKDGVLHGTGHVGESGTVMVEMDPILSGGDVDIVVTRSQYIPYMVVIPAAALEGPYLTVSEFNFDGDNENVNYGTTVSMDMDVKNLGTDPATGVTITISGSDPYCTLTSAATVTVGNIAADEVINLTDAFTFDIADDAPDMYSVSLDLVIDGTAKETWESTLNFSIYAPVPEFGTYTIDDAAGNGNGRLDPGETADITISTYNNGHAASIAGTLGVSSSSSFITVNTTNIDVAAIDADGMEAVTFTISTEASTPIGTLVDINLDFGAGNYTTSMLIQELVGLILEDFETGDFTSYNWEFNSNPWSVVGSDEAYEGEHGTRSATVGDNQESIMELNYTVAADGDFSFYYKVSSESGYDKLKFYIDGTMQDEWSGEVAWTIAEYTLTADEHILKWEYSKDVSQATGEDCAWVDYIVFPASSDNVLTAAFNVSEVTPCEDNAIDFTSTSLGDVTSWNWTFEGGTPATSSDENPSVTYAAAGDYNVVLEVSNGTETATITKEDFISVQNCTGIESIEAGISLYPNPNNGVFFLDIQGMDQANLTIVNALGTIVYQESNLTVDNSMKRIDLSQEAEGIYMLIVENDNQRMIEKVIIK